MAELWYGHFDSTAEDPRKLLAAEWAAYIESFITNGVRNGGSNLQVTENVGMTVKIDKGTANIRGYIMQLREDFNGRYYQVVIPDAHPQYPRIDRLVLRLDRRIASRSIKPVISLGVAAPNPIPPALTRTETEVYELSLAQIRVAANTLAITAADIKDERFDTELCGLINSVLGVDSSAWQNQFDDFMVRLGLQGQEIVDEVREDLQQYSGSTKEQFNDLIRQMETQSFTLINNNFEDWSVKRGCDYKTEFLQDGNIKETINIVNLGLLLAEKLTEFSMEGNILETITFYPWENTEEGNTFMTTTFNVSKETLFEEDGSIREVVR